MGNVVNKKHRGTVLLCREESRAIWKLNEEVSLIKQIQRLTGLRFGVIRGLGTQGDGSFVLRR